MRRAVLLQRGLSLLLAFSVLLSLAACSGGGKNTAAATMRLRRTEGTVAVSTGGGKSLPVLDNLGLYSGYGVGTRSASYAWIDLDDVKLTKLDQNSEISIEQEGRTLDIRLKSGSLFFNVTQPLEDDETMNIRTSTMLVGVRGTCGWVEANDGLSRVYLLEGKVECSAGGQTVQIKAGEFAELTEDGDLTVKEFTDEDIPAFVRDEADEAPGPDGSEAPEPTAEPEGELIASGQAGENVTWSLDNGVLTISGTGNMEDYSSASSKMGPWYESRNEIETVIIEGGVTSIGKDAFRNCGSLIDVTIPNSVISIGAEAFAYSGLTSVTIPDSVTSIGNGAFLNCHSLTSVTISNGVTTIAENTFMYCNSLTSVIIPDGVISIERSAFYKCTNLASVTIPNSVTSIGDFAFSVSQRLTNVTIPDSVTNIGASAFYYCVNLTSVTIPDSVTSIGEKAFDSTKLTDVYYGGSESQWGEISIEAANTPLTAANIHYNS